MATSEVKTEPDVGLSPKPATFYTWSGSDGQSCVVSTSHKKPTTDCFRSTVTIEIGPQKKAFTIHKELLCFYSGYFRAAFNGSFQEASEGRLPLPDEDVDTFEIVNGFLYTQQVRDANGHIGSDLDWQVLMKLWVFGDKFIIPLLQNITMNTLFDKQKARSIIPISQTTYIYAKTPAGSPLRRFLIDLLAIDENIPDTTDGTVWDNFPRESLIDLVNMLAGLRSARRMTKSSKRKYCDYHIHVEGEHCE